MSVSRTYMVKVLTVGLISLLLFTVVLSWPRKLCDTGLQIVALESQYRNFPTITLSELTPDWDANQPVAEPSQVSARPNRAMLVMPWALFDDLAPRPRGSHTTRQLLHSSIHGDGNGRTIYLDDALGLFVICDIVKEGPPNQLEWKKTIRAYAGPEGVSATPDERLGRFVDPILGWPFHEVIFDKGLSRFFRIDFENKTVTSAMLPEDGAHKPIDIGQIGKNRHAIRISWDLKRFSKVTPNMGNIGLYPASNIALVLDETGRIDKLDLETLNFVGTAGHLPVAESQFLPVLSSQPNEFSSYNVLPFTVAGEYRGCIASTLSGDLFAFRFSVFNEKGRQVGAEALHMRPDNAPGGVALMIGKYLMENLHPPILSIASFFAPFGREPTAGHRSLFVLPYSYIGILGSNVDDYEDLIENVMLGLLVISPSILFGIVLAWRVRRNATVVGLCKDAKLFWTIATIAFGLSAYITYRLTRPKITMVTCGNCGKLRRPDLAHCHRCGSKWYVPELIAPAWRVIDVPEDSDQPETIEAPTPAVEM